LFTAAALALLASGAGVPQTEPAFRRLCADVRAQARRLVARSADGDYVDVRARETVPVDEGRRRDR
jgi:hypothetical protein